MKCALSSTRSSAVSARPGLIISFLLVLGGCAWMYPYKRIPANRGSVTEIEGKYYSPRLKRIIPYYLVLPTILTPEERIPVVYFLHGRNGSRHMFRDLGGPGVVERYLGSHGHKYAVVGLTGAYSVKGVNYNTYWVDGASKNSQQWARLVIKEMIPWIEQEHRIGGEGKRAIAGISMGAHGALQLSLNHAGFFKCTAGHSLVVRDRSSMNQEFPGLFGTAVQFAQRDPLSLLKKLPSGARPFENVWADIGGKDDPRFINWARNVAGELQRLGYSTERGDKIDIGSEFPQGDHTYVYWTRRLPQYVGWYGRCLEGKRKLLPPLPAD